MPRGTTLVAAMRPLVVRLATHRPVTGATVLLYLAGRTRRSANCSKEIRYPAACAVLHLPTALCNMRLPVPSLFVAFVILIIL